MGYYVNTNAAGRPLPSIGKAQILLQDAGAQKVDGKTFQDNLICVVSNGMFEAAGFAYDEREYNVFSAPDDDRSKVWLTHPLAKQLSGYKD